MRVDKKYILVGKQQGKWMEQAKNQSSQLGRFPYFSRCSVAPFEFHSYAEPLTLICTNSLRIQHYSTFKLSTIEITQQYGI